MSRGALLPASRLAPPRTQLTWGGNKKALCLEAGHGQLRGLRVLYVQNKDYWCLQCIRQWPGPHHAPNKELYPAHWHATQTMVRVPLGAAPGPQEGGQADSWEGRDFKQKRSKKIQKEYDEKESQNQQPSHGAVPAGETLACSASGQAPRPQRATCWRVRSWSSVWGKSRPRKANKSYLRVYKFPPIWAHVIRVFIVKKKKTTYLVTRK